MLAAPEVERRAAPEVGADPPVFPQAAMVQRSGGTAAAAQRT